MLTSWKSKHNPLLDISPKSAYSLKNSSSAVKLLAMTFNDVIAELALLTFEERQILIRRALELDDPPLSATDEELVEAW